MGSGSVASRRLRLAIGLTAVGAGLFITGLSMVVVSAALRLKSGHSGGLAHTGELVALCGLGIGVLLLATMTVGRTDQAGRGRRRRTGAAGARPRPDPAREWLDPLRPAGDGLAPPRPVPASPVPASPVPASPVPASPGPASPGYAVEADDRRPPGPHPGWSPGPAYDWNSGGADDGRDGAADQWPPGAPDWRPGSDEEWPAAEHEHWPPADETPEPDYLSGPQPAYSPDAEPGYEPEPFYLVGPDPADQARHAARPEAGSLADPGPGARREDDDTSPIPVIRHGRRSNDNGVRRGRSTPAGTPRSADPPLPR